MSELTTDKTTVLAQIAVVTQLVFGVGNPGAVRYNNGGMCDARKADLARSLFILQTIN